MLCRMQIIPIKNSLISPQPRLFTIIAHSYENTWAWKTHYVQWEAVSVASKWSRFTEVSRDQIQDEAPEPGPNPSSATIRKHDLCVISRELSDYFLSLRCAIIAIKICHWTLMLIYSLAEGVCCKASALAASALATNTYVSAINLHQCSTADLNPYNSALMCFRMWFSEKATR